MTVTQKQIAEHVGVSVVLVSRALSDHPSVRPVTREKIKAAARDMGYGANTNRGARIMAARRHDQVVRTNTIAVVFPMDGVNPGGLRKHPYFMPLFEAVEAAALSSGTEILFCPARSGILPGVVSSLEVDGIITIFALTEHYNMIVDMPLPCVTLNMRHSGLNSVAPDGRDGMRKMVAYLTDLGHRRIAYVSQPTSVWLGTERHHGYLEGLAAYEIPRDTQLEELECSDVAGAIDRLLKRSDDISAIVCYNDPLAMEVVTYLRHRGLSVPGDISVTGFDDTSRDYGFELPITSIHSDSNLIGKTAIRLLSEILSQSPTSVSKIREERHLVTPISLAVRQSTAPPSAVRQNYNEQLNERGTV